MAREAGSLYKIISYSKAMTALKCRSAWATAKFFRILLPSFCVVATLHYVNLPLSLDRFNKKESKTFYNLIPSSAVYTFYKF